MEKKVVRDVTNKNTKFKSLCVCVCEKDMGRARTILEWKLSSGVVNPPNSRKASERKEEISYVLDNRKK